MNNQKRDINSTFRFTCDSQQGDLPLSFEWTKNGHTIKSSERYLIEIFELSSTLTIKRISKDDAGNYTCKVRNAYGSDSQNVHLNVKGNSD